MGEHGKIGKEMDDRKMCDDICAGVLSGMDGVSLGSYSQRCSYVIRGKMAMVGGNWLV